MKIAILTPTRQRPKELYRFFDSINKTVSRQNKIYFLFGIDSDDPGKKDYYDILRMMQDHSHDNIIMTMIEEERRPIGKIWNELARMKAWNDSPDVFIMGNDDLVYITPDWDIILEERLMAAEHPFFCYYFDDSINGEKHCAFPIVTKHWVGALGYFVPDCFHFFYHDTWVFDIAKKTGVTKYIPEVVIKHLHFSNGSSPRDNTYMQWRNNDTHNVDTTVFKLSDKNRMATAEMITERIEKYLNLKNTAK